MTEKLNINQWDEADRPREKLMAKGYEALSSAELLAILIGSGNTDETAVELMRRILTDCKNSLTALGRKNVKELSRYKGIGPAKAVTILAACELGRRRAAETPEERPQMASPENIDRYMRPLLAEKATEECWALLLNRQLRLIKAYRVGSGGLDEASADIRCILREALMEQAVALVLCHNHPSGHAQPSKADDRLTHKLGEAARLMDLRLIDHLILTETGYYSYADESRI